MLFFKFTSITYIYTLITMNFLQGVNKDLSFSQLFTYVGTYLNFQAQVIYKTEVDFNPIFQLQSTKRIIKLMRWDPN